MNAPGERMALRAVKLRKIYGSMVALEELSFTVKPGEIVGLLGPNGAGKTTTINMILGVLQPTSGSVLIGEIDRTAGALQCRGRGVAARGDVRPVRHADITKWCW